MSSTLEAEQRRAELRRVGRIPAVRRMRVIALTLLVVAGTVNYLDRSALSIGNGAIRQSLGLSDAEMGLLLSSFAVAYGVAQIPTGILVDRKGPRQLLGIGMLLWSVAQIAAGGVRGFGSFLLARAALGLGEAPMYLAGTKVCTNWFPARDRAFPIGLFNASSALGPAIAPPLLTALLLAYGWRPMFVIIGLAGLLVAGLWVLLYRDPEQQGVDEQARAALHAEDSPADRAEAMAGWPSLLKQRTTWAMAVGFAGVIYLTWLYGTWLPDYLQRSRHLSVRQAGIWTAVPQLCGFAGALLGGLASRLLSRRGMDAVASCKWPLMVAMLATGACTAAAGYVQSTAIAVTLISVALFAGSLASSCGWALAAVATTPDKVATLEAIQNVGGSVGGALAPAVTGALVDWTGSFTPALLLAAGLAGVTAVIYGVGVHSRPRAAIA
ncbi:MFS transporter [Rhizosaccharibacter radicis]|uniref:MFS transporter n=1 Tax=Rhizosaccharibacter radicis TaxID=2782605 RepID=A0ABT1VYK5_9PROT|nr:MFS transporter [Acetobacteraceae bacterium KSS12]